jgi:hypothetical protein
MKKIIISTFILILIAPAMWAQVNKTQLSLDIKAKYQQNAQQLAQYTWQRTTQVFMKGELKTTMLSAISIGPDGKLVDQLIEKESTGSIKPGVRGAIQKNEIEDLKTYVKNAITLVNQYIFMSKGQMVDLFDKGTLSELGGNLQVQGFNFIVQGDNLQFLYNMTSLETVSQTLSTVMNGDPVKAKVVYKIFNGVNVVDNFTLDLPAKGLNATVTNSQFAKKLQ